MLSSGYVDYTIAQGTSTPGSPRESEDSSPPLTPISSMGSTTSISTMSNNTQITLNDIDLNVSLNTDLTFGGVTNPINVSLDITKLKFDKLPDASRQSSSDSVSSVSSGSFYSFESENSLSSSSCHLNFKSVSRDRKVESIFKEGFDPSILLSRSSIKQDIERTKDRLMAKMTQKQTDTENANLQLSEQQANDILDRLLSNNITNSNLSGFLVADAVGRMMDILVKLSIAIYPLDPDKKSGGYRRRNGPILATIGRKIVNNGIYRAIKPKLMASVYGKSKRRQRKRYTKKRGLKKGRKQMTKKIYRKRRSTHKKYKRR
jgi:hypothetical protein